MQSVRTCYWYTHIDVFKSCLGPLKCHLRYIFNYTLKIIEILLKSFIWQNFQYVFNFMIHVFKRTLSDNFKTANRFVLT